MAADAANAGTFSPVWDSLGEGLSKNDMDLRIRAAVTQRGWEEVVKIFAKKNIPIKTLKIAEAGCGTGTIAMTFALIGASVTLIDNNDKVLERAGKLYDNYALTPNLIKADCLESPPAGLEGTFDLVISSGLAEHFTGPRRKLCIEYHRKLAKRGGVVFITVPNKWNAAYWCMRTVRRLTGTWHIDIEAPFSAAELKSLAGEIGFCDIRVIGYTGLLNDIADGLRGIGYAVIDGFPKRWSEALRTLGRRIAPAESRAASETDMAAYCAMKASLARTKPRRTATFADPYISELVLLAFI